MNVICDTNIFIHFFNGHLQTDQELHKIGLSNVVIPSIVLMELVRGMKNKNDLAQLKKRVKNFNVLHFDVAVSQKAIALIETYRLSHDLNLPDTLIGASAITYQLPLFTYNTKDFRYMPGLLLY